MSRFYNKKSGYQKILLDMIWALLQMPMVYLFLILPSFTLFSQNCNYPPGEIQLQESAGTFNSFYQIQYCIVNATTSEIIQIQNTPTFSGLEKGTYEAYSISYKQRDSILNLEIGKQLMEVNSACFEFSIPYSFSVCAVPEISGIDTDTLKVCGNGTNAIIADSIQVNDEDGLLDTFSIEVTIVAGGELLKDSLGIDISSYPHVVSTFSSPTLSIENVTTLDQVEELLSLMSFYTYSRIEGIRTIAIKILDGSNDSNILNRQIQVCPLPEKPTWNFTNEEDR